MCIGEEGCGHGYFIGDPPCPICNGGKTMSESGGRWDGNGCGYKDKKAAGAGLVDETPSERRWRLRKQYRFPRSSGDNGLSEARELNGRLPVYLQYDEEDEENFGGW
jgi:hypothetical protein